MGSILFSKSSIFIMVFSRDFHEKIKGKYGRFVRTFKNLKKSWKCRCIKMWTQFQKEFQHMFLFFAAVSFSDKKWNQASRERIWFTYIRNICSTSESNQNMYFMRKNWTLFAVHINQTNIMFYLISISNDSNTCNSLIVTFLGNE